MDVAQRLSTPAAPRPRDTAGSSQSARRTTPPTAPGPARQQPVRRAPPPPGATAYATAASEDHTLRTPSLVVMITNGGRTAAEGRFLDASALEARLRSLARERPDAIVIVRPVPGAPERRVRDVADLCDRIGLHCLPFPAR